MWFTRLKGKVVNAGNVIAGKVSVSKKVLTTYSNYEILCVFHVRSLRFIHCTVASFETRGK